LILIWILGYKCWSQDKLKLDDIYQLEIAKLMHNVRSDILSSTFNRPLTTVSSVHTHQTRSSTSSQYFCNPVCS